LQRAFDHVGNNSLKAGLRAWEWVGIGCADVDPSAPLRAGSEPPTTAGPAARDLSVTHKYERCAETAGPRGTRVPLLLGRPCRGLTAFFAGNPGLRPPSGLHPGLLSRCAYGTHSFVSVTLAHPLALDGTDILPNTRLLLSLRYRHLWVNVRSCHGGTGVTPCRGARLRGPANA